MTCPCCSGADVYRSRRRGLFDKIQAWRGLWPYRCLACEERFFVAARYPAVFQAIPAHLDIPHPRHSDVPAAAPYPLLEQQSEDALLALHAAVYSSDQEAVKSDAEMVNAASDLAKMPVPHKVTR